MYRISLLVFVLLMACKSQQFTPLTYEKPMIIFGSGGGFTGAVKEYTLLNNGQLFSDSNNQENMKEMKRLSKNDVNQIFDNYDALKIATLDYDAPGNQYYYIRYIDAETDKKIMWGDRKTEVPQSLKVYFANLKRYVKLSS